ncbi:2TM domain-containing protein [Flavobacterium eburneipallidum]|uniref:2TM domain-containing protein n=1 Tax=Flavobacterium eburneipallidum TaxID=3003263 RepID=UPI0022AC478F|nr:2TM domain-containing protein [Flavobacterium eburneipallidum]
MENNIQQEERYFFAQKKVKSIKGFYSHLFFYLVINAIITIQIYLRTGSGFWDWENFYTPLFWGIGLLAHGLSVFGQNLFFGQNWEERKIREFMNKEKNKKWE